MSETLGRILDNLGMQVASHDIFEKKMYLGVKVPGAEYSSCAIYFWAETGEKYMAQLPLF